MKVLVTGRDGFIATNLIHKMKGMSGCETIAYDKNWAFHIHRLQNIDVVIHLGAVSGIKACEDDIVESNNLNVNVSIQSIQLAKETNVSKFIFASSQAAVDPTTIYGIQKKYIEEVLKISGLNYTILRLSNVFGPYSSHKTSVIHQFIKNAINHKPLQIHHHGASRDFIYVDDVCQCIINSINTESYITDVKTGTLVYIEDVARMIANLSEVLLNHRPEIEPRLINVYREPIGNNIDLYNNILRTFNWYVNNYQPSGGGDN